MCVFCEIIKGNIPCYKVYEDDSCIAFLDISQVTIGHTLVIPKKHVKNIFELDSETAGHIGIIVNKLAKKISIALNTTNINIINNNGILAGQSVDHFHVHIIPRYNNDNLVINYPNNKLNETEFIELVNKIKIPN